jgi:hypothetical protein
MVEAVLESDYWEKKRVVWVMSVFLINARPLTHRTRQVVFLTSPDPHQSTFNYQCWPLAMCHCPEVGAVH